MWDHAKELALKLRICSNKCAGTKVPASPNKGTLKVGLLPALVETVPNAEWVMHYPTASFVAAVIYINRSDVVHTLS